jgi:hypothetical protein
VGPPDTSRDLRALLSVDAWAARDLPKPERLLGDLITRTSRTFIVGRTGLGKTMFGVALATSVAINPTCSRAADRWRNAGRADQGT